MCSRFALSHLPGVMVLPAVIVLMLAAGQPAQAQQLTPEQKQEMREHYEKAQRAYDVQRFPEAIEEYQKTYEIGGDPGMLFNVAQAYRLNGQLPDAVFYYRRYLERSPNAVNRSDVEQKIADLEKTIEASRAAAANPPPAAPPPPPAAQTPPPVTQPPLAAPLEASASGSRNTKRTVGIALLSAGAVGLLTAAITGKLAENRSDNLTYASMIKGTFDPNLERSGKTLDNVAVVSVVLGAGAAVAGGVLLFLSRRSPGDDQPTAKATAAAASVAPVVGKSSIGLSAAMSF